MPKSVSFAIRGVALAAIVIGLVAQTARADDPGIVGVDVVFLQRDCAGGGHTLGTDCFEDLAALSEFLWSTATTTGIDPTSADPMIVDVGVGDFPGPLVCENGGFVTFRGVGRTRSRFLNPSSGALLSAVHATDCDDLEFQDLAFIGQGGFLGIGVTWTGSGTSTWTDVEMVGDYTSWWDLGTCNLADRPIHYFFGSRAISHGSYGYLANCGEHWFYGSEIRMEATREDFPQPIPRRGVVVFGDGDVRMFGSSIRSFPGAGFTRNDDFVGVGVGITGSGGIFHMHGGIVSVDAGGPGHDAIGIDTGTDATAFVHTLGTAFVVKKGSGSAIRIRGSGTMQSPLLWQSGADVPVGGVSSQTGKDIFVETDCNPITGACDGSGAAADLRPHLMVYSEECASVGAATPWFDLSTDACRQP